MAYTPTFKTVSLSIMSLKDFQDAELAEQVFQAINEVGKDFIPDVYGESEPLRLKYDPTDPAPLIRLWADERDGIAGTQRSFAGAEILMEKRKKLKTSYQMRWQKNQQASFNYLIFTVDIDWVKNEENFRRFMELGNRLLVLLEPVQANIWNKTLPEWYEPINLRVRHPELAWINYFGKPYIELFGREKLLSAPCFRTFEIGKNLIGLQMTEDLFQPIPSDVRYAVKKHLGEDAFVEEGKWYRMYKTGRVPAFDFSNVLFDPSKPIEEPQIRMRQTKKP